MSDQLTRGAEMRTDLNAEQPADPPVTYVTQEIWDRTVAERDSLQGYRDAFYEIGQLLGLPAMPISPKEAFEMVMLPKLRRLVAAELALRSHRG